MQFQKLFANVDRSFVKLLRLLPVSSQLIHSAQDTYSTNQHRAISFNPLDLLDFCKGLAILWVFLVHCKGGWFGWQGVHVFIVLSGFGLTYSCLKRRRDIDWKQWYIKRSARILPTYWLACLFGFLVLLFVRALDNSEVGSNSLNPLIRLVLNLSLLRNLFYQISENSPDVALWFIPLIVGFYLIFPWLYTWLVQIRSPRGWLLMLVGLASIEFLYRAAAIYWLDGTPVAYTHGFFDEWAMTVQPLDNLRNTLFTSFQEAAPFQIFPSRIAEFLFGMIGAIALTNYNQTFNRLLFNRWVGIASVGIWVAGNALVYAGLWGWIFADFIIAIGLVVWMLNFAYTLRIYCPNIFATLSQLSPWSYYIFLSHYLFIYPFKVVGIPIAKSANIPNGFIIILGFSFIVVMTWISSWMLMKFDQSKWSNIITQNTVGKLLS